MGKRAQPSRDCMEFATDWLKKKENIDQNMFHGINDVINGETQSQ